MRKIFVTAAIAFFMLLPILATTPCNAADEGEVITHTVKAGDTLWGIAHKYFKDPKGWMGIWKNNPEVRNPHLIRPGDIIRLSAKKIEVERNGEVIEEIVPEKAPEKIPDEEIPEEAEEEIPTPVTRYSKTTPVEIPTEAAPEKQPSLKLTKLVTEAIARSGFVTKSKMVNVGRIVKSKEGELYYSPGSILYVAFIDPTGIEPGDRFTLYNQGKKEIKHPVTKKSLGHTVEFVGTIEVTEIHPEVIETKVVDSYKEITRNDLIMQYQPPISEVYFKESITTVEGLVVSAYADELMAADNRIIYIDKGINDGIEEGTMLTALKPATVVADPYDKTKKRKLPKKEVGRIVVIRAGDNVSTALVIHSSESIVRGDLVSTVLPKEEPEEETTENAETGAEEDNTAK
ncbi:MAG: LysM peptidoglycan-binding domain-containing protein [Deltaproteobacteria bacterium]|nr:LysM peptidoglycan-binding domain-containing protein [Deltaproteobacteria bacterium]